MVQYTIKRGSFNKESCQQWVSCLLNKVRYQDTGRVVIICDNAPCHNGLEELFQKNENENFGLLRLGPYSPALNPIEGIWSVLKSVIKKKMRDGYTKMLQGHLGQPMSKTKWRIRFLEKIAQESQSVITPGHCSQMVTYVRQRYTDVLEFKDL